MPTLKNVVRMAAIGDLHYSRSAVQGSLQPLFSQIAESADILLVCGDLTDYGTLEEGRALAKEITSAVKIPVVAVLGNHDYESGQQDELRKILNDAGVVILDGDTTEVHGIGFAGVKGFAGGFGRRALGPWGEDIIKQFVREAINEALKLESALARLRTDQLIALLHYAPIQDTVEGEPREIFPFLGCSRLEEPLNRFPVTAVFHGHAHHGQPEGRTSKGVPVYNVSMSLMREIFPGRPFRLIEVHPHNDTDERLAQTHTDQHRLDPYGAKHDGRLPESDDERRVGADRRTLQRA
jgi:Icc-related predicted phosphoesterase